MGRRLRRKVTTLPFYILLAVVCLGLVASQSPRLQARPSAETPQQLITQSQAEADSKSAGCVTCHVRTDQPTMHATGTVRLGCMDCHTGDNSVRLPAGLDPERDIGKREYDEAKKKAHPQPTRLEPNPSGPVRAYAEWVNENTEYVQFVNPGDLRVAEKTCGQIGCHKTEARFVQTSLMTTASMLWGTAMYNNGSIPFKNPIYAESYGPDGKPRALRTWPPPTKEETRKLGILPELRPIPRWETSQMGNILRVFERGGRKKQEIGNPTREEEAGKTDTKNSDRGLGTLLRTDPVYLGLQKTRLLDPILHMPGSNDNPGDYRHSGCSGCHVIYANDRFPAHSGPYAKYGNEGKTVTVDPTIPKDRPGHPIRHEFTRAIPTSQCMVCHMHPGTNMVTTYYGFTWWDNEVDGKHMYPEKQVNPSEKDIYRVAVRNPEGSAVRGLWGNEDFLKRVGEKDFVNNKLKDTQFADFHGHGWIFRAVYKRDRKGNLLDAKGNKIHADANKLWDSMQWPTQESNEVRSKQNNPPDGMPVHLKDIHLQKGMHCIDCHFWQDNHGNGNLYGAPRDAVEIGCQDCHGTIREKAKLVTTGPAAPCSNGRSARLPETDPACKERGTPLERFTTPWKEKRFYWKGGKLFQRSVVEQGLEWEVVQTVDTITPGNPHYNEQSRYAKTVMKDGRTWGAAGRDNSQLAHSEDRMTCFACHTSWTTSCFGCHLSQYANKRMPMQHNEGLMTRNWISYNFQILRDDVYMLGVDGTVTGNKISPVRSACAILVSSQNNVREWIYYMQQTISAEGYSGQAFSTYMPHTVRGKETKQCTDCHVSEKKDNNAWMSQVLLLGTNFVNFMGRYVWVATGKGGFEGFFVAERTEPAAIYGSDLHRLAYPDNYKKHLAGGMKLKEAYHHPGNILDVHARGEYLYAAIGKEGFRVYDIAQIDVKGFSERIVTALVSPLGQRFYVNTKNAVAVATPTTLGVDPLRKQLPENEEQPMIPNMLVYGFLYVADTEEGLVIIGDPDLATKNAAGPGVGTLLDGDPTNNFLKKAASFNPNGLLTGARRITFVGPYAYVLCNRGMVVVDLTNPLTPKVTAEFGPPDVVDGTGAVSQFRYLFVVDKEGMKVFDITDPAKPVRVPNAFVPLEDARNIYTARTYAYVAGGKQGLVIIDIERPEHPKLDQIFRGERTALEPHVKDDTHKADTHGNGNGNGNGKAQHGEQKGGHGGGKQAGAHGGGHFTIDDLRDVKIGMVSASVFAFLADGHNGFKVVQLISAEETPGHYGFSPRPTPKLIAVYHTHTPALAVSEGIDRDRAVDEVGNQLAVFGRRGARPFNKEEMRRMYVRDGKLFTVTDTPPTPPVEPKKERSLLDRILGPSRREAEAPSQR
jgi:hypothetical protein